MPHCVGVERSGLVPGLAGSQGGAGRAIEDAVAVAAADGGEAGAPVGRNLGRGQDDDRVRLEMEVQRVAQPGGADGPGQVEMGDLAGGVNAGIGAAGGDAGDRVIAVQLGGGGFENSLD